MKMYQPDACMTERFKGNLRVVMMIGHWLKEALKQNNDMCRQGERFSIWI